MARKVKVPLLERHPPRQESPTMQAAKRAFRAQQQVSLAPKHPYLREYLTNRANGWDHKMEFDLRDILMIAAPIKPSTPDYGVDISVRGHLNWVTVKADYEELKADRRVALDGYPHLP